MFKQAFDKINMQSAALNAYALRQGMIAQNIANVETPGYKRKDVHFDSLLNQKMSDLDGFHLNVKMTNAKHMSQRLPFDAHVVSDFGASMRLDKNSVNIETEMAEQAKNAIRYNTVISRVDAEFRKLQSAIKGGR